MALREALNKLNDAVTDLTSLHVQTFSGVVDLDVQPGDGFENLKQAVQKAKADGKIKLVAETLLKFDGDSYNFIVQDADGVSLKALDIHKNAVDSGLETRQALLALFQDLIG